MHSIEVIKKMNEDADRRYHERKRELAIVSELTQHLFDAKYELEKVFPFLTNHPDLLTSAMMLRNKIISRASLAG